MPEDAVETLDETDQGAQKAHEDAASIGKRYARQDLIGTPFCIAVDHQTLEDNTVTIRHRDTTEQERVPIAELHGRIAEATSFRRVFEKL